MYSYRGDTALDPFAGSGQTAKVAVALGRNAVGYDTRAEYIDYAPSRIEEPLRLRDGQLAASFRKIPLGQVTGKAARRQRNGSATATATGKDEARRRLLESPA